MACTLLGCWEEGHEDPWLVVTDLTPKAADICWYGLCAWIEQSFKQIKSGGWQWQKTRMDDPERAERLWLAIALATWWLLTEGAAAEDGVARQAVAVGQAGREAVRGEFLPRVFVRASVGRTDGQNVITGWHEAAGLHVEAPLYASGRHRGELRAAEAEIEAALAEAQTILEAISLQVNLTYRGVITARDRIDLARNAVAQARDSAGWSLL